MMVMLMALFHVERTSSANIHASAACLREGSQTARGIATRSIAALLCLVVMQLREPAQRQQPAATLLKIVKISRRVWIVLAIACRLAQSANPDCLQS